MDDAWTVWDDDKVARLRALGDEGKTLEQIAEALGVSYSAVVRKRTRLGLADASTFWTQEKTDLLCKMAAAGKNAREIGEALGCNRNAVLGKMQRLRIKAATPAKPPKPPKPAKAPKPAARIPREEAPPMPRVARPADPVVQSYACEPVHLLDLRLAHCRAYLGEQKYCGAPMFKRSFCKLHYRDFYVASEKVRLKPKVFG